MSSEQAFNDILTVPIYKDMAIALRKTAKKYDEPLSAIVRLAIREFLVKEAQDHE